MVVHQGYLQESCSCSTITHFHCKSFTLSPLGGGGSTSGFVLLSRDAEFSREFYCTYVIEAPRDMHVSVRINDLRLPMLGASCKASVLRLYDGNSTQQASRQLIGMRSIATTTAFPVVFLFCSFVVSVVSGQWSVVKCNRAQENAVPPPTEMAHGADCIPL